MTANTEHQPICSVTELAKKLGLSRARFYQLQNAGVFPPPVYCLYTKRPFYPMDLQEKCLQIRKSGIGLNGRPIIFYTKRLNGASDSKISVAQSYKELSESLCQMGLKVSMAKIKKAITTLYPGNWKKLEVDSKVIVEVFKYLKNGV